MRHRKLKFMLHFWNGNHLLKGPFKRWVGHMHSRSPCLKHGSVDKVDFHSRKRWSREIWPWLVPHFGELGLRSLVLSFPGTCVCFQLRACLTPPPLFKATRDLKENHPRWLFNDSFKGDGRHTKHSKWFSCRSHMHLGLLFLKLLLVGQGRKEIGLDLCLTLGSLVSCHWPFLFGVQVYVFNSKRVWPSFKGTLKCWKKTLGVERKPS